MAKRGVLLVNLGTPDKPSRFAVYRYLKQFLLDKRVIDYSWLLRNFLVRCIIAPFRSGSSVKLYQRLWKDEGSPLKIYGETVARRVQKVLGSNYSVVLSMRYQSPSIQLGLEKLIKRNVSSITVFPLFPQYASATTGSVYEEVMRCLQKMDAIPSLHFINSYYDHPSMIDVICHNAKKRDFKSYDHYVFAFHGIPQRQLRKADTNSYCLKSPHCCFHIEEKNQFCYSAQCHATANAIVKKLKISKKDFSICFQSRFGPEKWTRPYMGDVLQDRLKKGNKKILAFSPAFVADCLETTIEIGVDYKKEFLEAGGDALDLVESLNEDPKWISMIAEMVK